MIVSSDTAATEVQGSVPYRTVVFKRRAAGTAYTSR
jgi:hypothetical protein